MTSLPFRGHSSIITGVKLKYSPVALLLCIFAFLLLPQSCGKPDKDQIILISLDTLRPDYLGVYDSQKKTSPNINKLAEDSIVCTDAISQASTTILSHKSIFYSVYPSIHKITLRALPKENGPSPLEILKSKGFKTAGFTEGGQMSRKFGFNRGFDSYWEPGTGVDANSKLQMMKPLVFDWVKKNYREKFLLFLHTYQVHCPYFPPEPYRSEFAGWYDGTLDAKYKCGRYFQSLDMREKDYNYLRSLYMGEVRYTDEFIGEFIRLLKKLKIYDNATIILFSDHGESLGERKYVGHNQMYQVQLRIPMILKLPGIKPDRLTSPVESVDIMPTLFDLLQIKPPYAFQGRSILPLLKKKSGERYRFAERPAQFSVQKSEWKGIFQRKDPSDVSLYNIKNDPLEKNDLAQQHPEIVADLRKAYENMQRNSRALSARFELEKASRPDVDPELQEDLKALGYVQ